MRIINGVTIILAFILGFYVSRQINFKSSETKNSSTILLERIKEVFKIVYIEAQFNELYSHKDYTWVDISPFRKSAIVRIQATVTAGINMDSSKIEMDEKTKTIRLSFDSSPVILNVDHKLDYFDLQQGSFNYFSADELTGMQEQARGLILKKANESDLLARTTQKKNEMLLFIDQLANSMGWKLQVTELKKLNRFAQ